MVTSVLLAGANRATLMADSGEAPGCGGFEELTANGVMCWMRDGSGWQLVEVIMMGISMVTQTFTLDCGQ